MVIFELLAKLHSGENFGTHFLINYCAHILQKILHLSVASFLAMFFNVIFWKTKPTALCLRFKHESTWRKMLRNSEENSLQQR